MLVPTRRVKGTRKTAMKAPVGQKSLHQKRGKINSSRRKRRAIKENSSDTSLSLTNIIASVLRIPGALT
jgi:hypothetical protein